LAKQPKAKKQVEALKHDEASRKNIPTAEYQSLIEKENLTPIEAAYERRNRDLDPQLVWRGKDEQDWSDLVVPAPPLYIQEKVHPKVLIDDLLRRSSERESKQAGTNFDLFADFNGLPSAEAKTEFYQHDANWSNRMILGDSLQVMASLAEREGLRGKVQCVYIDPPYGIKFNSNFQWSTTSRDVKDGNAEHITREPEQVKAFRDTWRDGIHSYLTYLRDRLTVARDLLTDSGSVFVQIGDENVHRVRTLMDEVFGQTNCVSQIAFAKTSGSTDEFLGQTTDYLLWYARDVARAKFRPVLKRKRAGEAGGTNYNRVRDRIGFSQSITPELLEGPAVSSGELMIYSLDNLTSQSAGRDKGEGAASWFEVVLDGVSYRPSLSVRWKTNEQGMSRLKAAGRLEGTGKRLGYVRYLDDFPAVQVNNRWEDVSASFMADKVYVVQTSPTVVQRCLLMTSDPGDLVLDPTCGSGTTAYIAEQWGRRWITIDTSRVALALARARIMGARYPYYLLADSREGQAKEADITRRAPTSLSVRGNIRQGFVYERVPHITLKSIVNNAEVDVIWGNWQAKLEPLREQLNSSVKQQWQDWEIPRDADSKWPDAAKKLHAAWWAARLTRQQEIDDSIAARAEFEYLYDKPYLDSKKVRVAGPFTVESLSPHRVLGVDQKGDLVDSIADRELGYAPKRDFASMILENLRIAGVQQAHQEDRIVFTSLLPWPGTYVCADGRYVEGNNVTGSERRAAIFIGPEFGTVSRPDLVTAAREAADGGFDVLIACAFNFEAHATEFSKLGRVPVLKARMNADLHMAEDLKNTGKGNLFVIFGEPDLDLLTTRDGQLQVRIKGVDVFHPSTGEVHSAGPDNIACWFIDTDYNEESFFVRHAYFLGQNDPYSALKTTLKAEINEEAWATLHSDTSRPFPKPVSGRIAVKVINHLGDEVMKVFRVEGKTNEAS
jgi:adenine-specific DNA-methyltransferase